MSGVPFHYHPCVKLQITKSYLIKNRSKNCAWQYCFAPQSSTRVGFTSVKISVTMLHKYLWIKLTYVVVEFVNLLMIKIKIKYLLVRSTKCSKTLRGKIKVYVHIYLTRLFQVLKSSLGEKSKRNLLWTKQKFPSLLFLFKPVSRIKVACSRCLISCGCSPFLC